MIDNNLVFQIKYRANKDYISIVGKYIDLKRCGKYHRGLCPFHADSHPSLDFYLNDNDECAFICRSCGKSGDLITFIEEIEHVKFDEAVRILGDMVGISTQDGRECEVRSFVPVKVEKPQKTKVTMPFELVQRFMGKDSVLVTFLKTKFPSDLVDKAVSDYYLGEHEGWTVYWQIDKSGRVLTGKLMEYASDGHRVRDKGRSHANWAHSIFDNAGKVKDEAFGRCLFGEHLLERSGNEQKTVIITESEKAAVICSMKFPQYVWVSCGGVSNLGDKLLQSLEGRNVIVFPDAGYYDQWANDVSIMTEGKGHKWDKDRGCVDMTKEVELTTKLHFKSIAISCKMEDAMAKGTAKYGDDVADLILASAECMPIELRWRYVAACKQIFLQRKSMPKTDFVSHAVKLYGHTWWNDSAVSDMVALGLIAEDDSSYLFTLDKCS